MEEFVLEYHDPERPGGVSAKVVEVHPTRQEFIIRFLEAEFQGKIGWSDAAAGSAGKGLRLSRLERRGEESNI